MYVCTCVCTVCSEIGGLGIYVPEVITLNTCVDGCGCGYTVACTYVRMYVYSACKDMYVCTNSPAGCWLSLM